MDKTTTTLAHALDQIVKRAGLVGFDGLREEIEIAAADDAAERNALVSRVEALERQAKDGQAEQAR